MLRVLTLVLLIISGNWVSASGGSPSSDVTEAEGWWNVNILDAQRRLDLHEPIRNGSWLGSHNTYNSEVYTDIDSYYDPQQKYSIYDQLRLGARFIELDAHWTAHLPSASPRLLLCHSGAGAEVGDLHLGCGLTDRLLEDGLKEIKYWLKAEKNKDEVILLYIEDHSDGEHDELYAVLNNVLGDKIYRSGGCDTVPADLTKADVLAAGKQVLVWKDRGCANDANLLGMAYSDLGMSRIWENATNFADIETFFTGRPHDHLSAENVRSAFEEGFNIVNLDDMVAYDGRLDAAVWSWAYPEPNNYGGNEDCALVRGEGARWNDADCANSYPYACYNKSNNSWVVTGSGAWDGGETACETYGEGYVFDYPKNAPQNVALRDAKGEIYRAWINLNDIRIEGKWESSNVVTGLDIERNDFKLRAGYNHNVCLDVDGTNRVDNGANVKIWNCSDSSETWVLSKSGKIQAGWNSDLCLDVSGTNSTSRGANIQIWNCSEVTETWRVLHGGKIQARWDTSKCLDVVGTNATNNGQNVGTWNCSEVTETWSIDPLGHVDYQPVKVMGMCMDIPANAANGSNAHISSCDNSDTQLWSYDVSTGYIKNMSNPALCLDSTHGNTPQTSVKVWSCENHINLKWDLVNNTIRPKKNNGLALDVKWGQANNGQDLWLWNSTGNAAQTFTWGN